MKRFYGILLGQFLSSVGSTMTGFALSLWLYDETAKASPLTFAFFLSVLPMTLLAPFAGVIVDRFKRRTVIICADILTASTLVVLLVLLSRNTLNTTHIYAYIFVAAFAGLLQFTALEAAITRLVPPENYARANGQLSMALQLPILFSPLLAALIYASIGLTNLFIIDFITFVCAIATLVFVSIPESIDESTSGTIVDDLLYGFRYVSKRGSYIWLVVIISTLNFITTFANALTSPMILARTNSNEVILGLVRGAVVLGALFGVILLSTKWLENASNKRPVRLIQVATIVGCIAIAALGVVDQTIGWVIVGLIGGMAVPVVYSTNSAIWQKSVPPAYQGRVFGATGFLENLPLPIASLLAGLLADRFFEPMMGEAGNGMRVMFVISGVLAGLFMLITFRMRSLNQLEKTVSIETQTNS